MPGGSGENMLYGNETGMAVPASGGVKARRDAAIRLAPAGMGRVTPPLPAPSIRVATRHRPIPFPAGGPT